MGGGERGGRGRKEREREREGRGEIGRAGRDGGERERWDGGLFVLFEEVCDAAVRLPQHVVVDVYTASPPLHIWEGQGQDDDPTEKRGGDGARGLGTLRVRGNPIVLRVVCVGVI